MAFTIEAICLQATSKTNGMKRHCPSFNCWDLNPFNPPHTKYRAEHVERSLLSKLAIVVIFFTTWTTCSESEQNLISLVQLLENPSEEKTKSQPELDTTLAFNCLAFLLRFYHMNGHHEYSLNVDTDNRFTVIQICSLCSCRTQTSV